VFPREIPLILEIVLTDDLPIVVTLSFLFDVEAKIGESNEPKMKRNLPAFSKNFIFASSFRSSVVAGVSLIVVSEVPCVY
jgi:hypothetical protein